MKIYEGKVVGKKMDKTATVEVERIVAHPLYRKRHKRTKTYHVHDELGVEVDQVVRFTDCKPISKLKKWKVIEVVGKKGSEKGARKGKRVVRKTKGGKK